MAITDLIPWRRKEPEGEQEERALQVREDPFMTFQDQMNRMFDSVFRGTGLKPFGASLETWDAFSPRVDVTETDQEIKVSAELPGLDEQDIDVGLTRNVLTINGQKRQEREEKGQNYVRTERSYGSFRRSIPLPTEVEANNVDAVFRHGVLTVTLPKTEKAQAGKKIRVKAQ
jgi:HSP20 family protein